MHFSGLSRKNNPGPVNDGADDGYFWGFKGEDAFSDCGLGRADTLPSDDWTGMIVLSGKEICVGLVSG